MSREDGYNISDTGNWNVASDYSKLKIMKPLYLCDEYATISTFGTSHLVEELQSNQLISIDDMKIRGFQRLIHHLIMIIDNSYFAIKKDKGREDLESYKKELIRFKKITGILFKYQVNHIRKTRTLMIIQDKYNPVLDRILEIKSLINIPLNRNHLIFTDKEEFDPQKYKKEIFDSITTRG